MAESVIIIIIDCDQSRINEIGPDLVLISRELVLRRSFRICVRYRFTRPIDREEKQGTLLVPRREVDATIKLIDYHLAHKQADANARWTIKPIDVEQRTVDLN